MLKKILQLMVVLLFITQGVMAQSIEIDDVTVAPGSIQVPMDMLGFTGTTNGDVAAITLYIEYDSELLDFTGLSNTTLTGQWLANYNSGSDQLIITWTTTSGNGFDVNGPLLDLNFDYKGGFSTAVSFVDASCEIANNSLGTISATYVAGSVDQLGSDGMISMGDLVEPIGNTVNMPLNIIGTGFGTVSSLTFMIAFDETELSFAGVSEDAITSVVANANGGMLEITWTGMTPMDFTALTHLLDMEFVYYGGDADVEFSPGCEINDASLGLLPFDYTNGTVTATSEVPTLTLSAVGGTPGDHVLVPIVASDFTTSVLGAMTLNISFDNAKLTYTGYTVQQLSVGWLVSADGSGNITLLWSNSGGSLLADGDLVTLDFIYDAAGGQADLGFAPGSIVESVNLVTIPVNFVGGSVANHEVSGKLTYMGYALRPIATAGTSTTTVYLKDVGDNSILYTTTTDVNGDFVFSNVGVGNFYLDASTDIDATLSYDVTDAFVIYGSTVPPNPPLAGQYALAGDVNEDTFVDVTDAFIVYGSVVGGNVKGPSWTAPDWFFENPAISVNSDLIQDFSAICSGDANGDFVPIP